MGENKKAPQAKMQKNGQQKIQEGPFLDLIWESPSYNSLNQFNSNANDRYQDFSKTWLQIPKAGANTGVTRVTSH